MLIKGKDDMPAHVKSSIFGCSLSVPITDGHLQLGTWQGIWLCEHRNHGGRFDISACFVTLLNLKAREKSFSP